MVVALNLVGVASRRLLGTRPAIAVVPKGQLNGIMAGWKAIVGNRFDSFYIHGANGGAVGCFVFQAAAMDEDIPSGSAI